MAQNLPVNASPIEADLYCTPDHVALVRREAGYSQHEPRGRHTRAQVITTIRWAMADIDRRCAQSWRLRLVTQEWQDLSTFVFDGVWTRIKLDNRQVADLVAASGDALQVRAGSSWEDYLATRTQGIAGEYYIQNEDGWLYLKRRVSIVTDDAIRITYRCGFTSVPEDIQHATALLAAAMLEETTIRGHPDNGGFSVENRAKAWERQAAQKLTAYIVIGGVT